MSYLAAFCRSPMRLAVAMMAIAAIHASPALAQTAKPAVTSTLDVCEDSATGNWRYSGVVSVLPPSTTQTSYSVDYAVQNGTERTGYQDVYKVNTLSGTDGALSSGDVRVVPFSINAAPLTLGSLRNAVRVQFYAQSTDPKLGALFTAENDVLAPVCGCGPKGCTRTQGYWGNKPGVVWPNGWYREMNFYSSGLTWQQILDTPPRGNAYIILADQFIAAVLNRNAGASAPQGVQDVMAAARDWFASGTTLQTCSPGTCELQKTWAATLDVYNNGNYPGGPPHCPD
ncbi:hypothetical protein NX773_08155 [Massilia solisilvae]|uniref:Uncharacterized protein n=1 Tax=Massilia solisilvae TaxID=1811225 RepID=A0ABT2BI54_9BURK|nr:hypothetical protein [Massilia solisilvae]MCS0608135.1 hypothetical protein [Massilia solisilvae]